ncbi:MAG TPA: hypothetical protein VNQ77_19240 [Frankiaceae bacterium]|nr:hypothetical protein [Frankiaceae bacterium]
MSPYVVALMVGMLGLNFFLWKRRGRGWRTHVDAFLAVLQPYVPEPLVDAVVLQPAGAVGRQARAEQGRGLRTIFGGMGGELSGAVAEARAESEADREELPPMTALALSEGRRYLLPVVLTRGVWSAGPVERSWGVGEVAYSLSGRALTIQVTISVGEWTGEYEAARDPAKYGETVLQRLAASG